MDERPVKTRRSSGRTDRWAEHRQHRRAELVESAVEAIREHGAGASIAVIAAQAGVTKPVLYRHFTDRADLQRAVSERGAQLLLSRLLPELAGAREPVDQIRAIVDAFLGAAEDEPELWRFVVHSPGGDQAASADVVAHNLALVSGQLSTVLGEELRRRDLDAGGAEAWAYGLAGLVYTAGDWWLQRRTMSRAALTDYLTQLIWGGLSGVLAGRRDESGEPESSLRLVAGLDADPTKEDPS